MMTHDGSPTNSDDVACDGFDRRVAAGSDSLSGAGRRRGHTETGGTAYGNAGTDGFDTAARDTRGFHTYTRTRCTGRAESTCTDSSRAEGHSVIRLLRSVAVVGTGVLFRSGECGGESERVRAGQAHGLCGAWIMA